MENVLRIVNLVVTRGLAVAGCSLVGWWAYNQNVSTLLVAGYLVLVAGVALATCSSDLRKLVG